jgi:hypothetical protein
MEIQKTSLVKLNIAAYSGDVISNLRHLPEAI